MPDHGTVTLVPSVHFSPSHCRRVRERIRAVEPDLVAVELDESRFERLEADSGPALTELSRELSPPAAAAYSAVRAFQRTVVRLAGLDPDYTDMEAAIETAAECDLDVALIDDPVAETLRELARRVGPLTIPRSMLRAQSMGPDAYVDQLALLEQPVAEISHGDDVQPAIDHLRRLFPEVAAVLIDRRDRSMARRLHALRREGYDVVAVVGAGHHNGVERRLATLEGERNAAERTESVPIRTPARTVTRIPIE
ncbi:TraB domain-containing protein [Natrinema sp. H-ect1]|uniref:TraB domain-containing protein n=1 Tax=Natrinema sp. H-ect1 TaxID=3242700 RepID=UPI00359DB878